MLKEDLVFFFEGDISPLLGLEFTCFNSIKFILVRNPGRLEVNEGSWSDISSDSDVSSGREDIEVANVDSEDGWDGNTRCEFSVKSSNAGINE